jgi:hypothetical protein
VQQHEPGVSGIHGLLLVQAVFMLINQLATVMPFSAAAAAAAAFYLVSASRSTTVLLCHSWQQLWPGMLVAAVDWDAAVACCDTLRSS